MTDDGVRDEVRQWLAANWDPGVDRGRWAQLVFDAGWAEAYMRAGGSYYPKLQVAVPFTPATGRRLLVRPGPQAGRGHVAAGSGAANSLPTSQSAAAVLAKSI